MTCATLCGMRKTPYAAVHLTHEARGALRMMVLQLSAQVGRRLTMSEVVLAAMHTPQDQILDQLDPTDT